MIKEKTCTKCGELKPAESFSRDRNREDGRRSACKVCTQITKVEKGITPLSKIFLIRRVISETEGRGIASKAFAFNKISEIISKK